MKELVSYENPRARLYEDLSLLKKELGCDRIGQVYEVPSQILNNSERFVQLKSPRVHSSRVVIGPNDQGYDKDIVAINDRDTNNSRFVFYHSVHKDGSTSFSFPVRKNSKVVFHLSKSPSNGLNKNWQYGSLMSYLKRAKEIDTTPAERKVTILGKKIAHRRRMSQYIKTGKSIDPITTTLNQTLNEEVSHKGLSYKSTYDQKGNVISIRIGFNGNFTDTKGESLHFYAQFIEGRGDKIWFKQTTGGKRVWLSLEQARISAQSLTSKASD